MGKIAKIKFSAEQATKIILVMPSDSDMSDLGDISEEDKLHHTEALPLEIINVFDDEEKEVYASKTDTEEQTNGPWYAGENISMEKNTSSNSSHLS